MIRVSILIVRLKNGGFVFKNRRRRFCRRIYRANKKRAVLLRSCVAAASAVLLFIFFDSLLRPFVWDNASASVINEAVYNINAAVSEILSTYESDFTDIADIKTDENGNVKAVSVSTAEVNRIKSEITKKLAESSLLKDYSEIEVPLGNLTDSVLLNGRGPRIKIKTMINNCIVSDIESTFENAGINQTRHCLYLVIKARVGAQISREQTDNEITAKVLISDTVIVGSVPSAVFSSKDE